jgi:hypothetical protein
MGVKSTTELTRERAIERATDLALEEMRKKVEDEIREMGNSQLEWYLESMVDRAAPNGESFENFLIVDGHDSAMKL